MTALIAGLLLFLGPHATRIFAEGFRQRQIAAHGLRRWKGLYSLVSLAGLVLIVWGYGQARLDPVLLWQPPRGMRHAALLLTLIAFVLLAASDSPRNHIKAALHHPMVLGVKVWAFAHLLANGMLADVVLFGSFLVWAIVLYAVSRRRDRREGTVYPPGTLRGTVITLVAGVGVWLLFVFWLHSWLIGVSPLG
ncbi:MAG: NnrU family protein [Aquincola tertiaricarbonis]|uniref:NnrU family protein n=1 Tax=Aquincola TaxID=391952 RepID=UPI000615210F|nr:MULTISPECIES: NnrU family protein [Aquincola]MCR5866101.1 NnrU family protein [Aquincola sp. J276]